MSESGHQEKVASGITIDCYVLGPWQTNCYVIRDQNEANTDCWIVDAGFQPQPMIQAIKDAGLNPVMLIFTHAHIDHIAGAKEICDAFGDQLPLLIHPSEKDFLSDPTLNLSASAGYTITAPPADRFLEDGDQLDFAGFKWDIIHTPGHSPGGITLYQAESKVALVGDTLFQESIGRYDFPTSNGPQLFASIRDRLFALPEDVTAYPGHGPSTTIGHERVANPFVGNAAYPFED